jgi:hypothetical protein
VSTTVHSAGLGRIVWTISLDSLKELEEFDDLLAADTAWNGWVAAQDGYYTGAVDDMLMSMIHVAPEGAPPAYVSVVNATAANGMLSKAMAAGVEAAMLLTRLTGLPTNFGSNVTGPYGGVMWTTYAPDMAAVEAANTAMASSPEFMELVDRLGPLYNPGGVTTLYRRLN